MCLVIGGEEEGHCDVGVIHRGTPHGGACPSGGGAHGGFQYPWLEGGGGVLELWLGCLTRGGGGQYPLGGGGGGHVDICLTMGDPLHDIKGVGLV
jgi:hypothetical protein